MNDFQFNADLATLENSRFVLDAALLGALAREVAMEINDLNLILANYGLTQEQWAEIKQNTTFKKMLESAVQAWASAANAPERIKIEAAATFEQVMPVIAKRLKNPSEGLDDVVRGARMLADVGGLVTNPAGVNGERVTINIDLGSDTLTLTHEVKPIEAAPSDVDVIQKAAAALPTRG